MSRVRVLYVEDVRALRELVVAAFDNVRFRVTVAAGVEAAQFLVSREQFDVVVCGEASTARTLWEFVCGRPTRVVVASDAPIEALPPGAESLPEPTPVRLRDAALRLRP